MYTTINVDVDIDDFIDDVGVDNVIEYIKDNYPEYTIGGYESCSKEELASNIIEICRTQTHIYTKKDLMEAVNELISHMTLPD